MWQEDKRGRRAFITHDGLFHFEPVLPGLASAAGVFQPRMSLILKCSIQCYSDDIRVLGEAPEEHENKIQPVLECIGAAGWKLSLAKCKSSQQELAFWGISFIS